MSAVRRDARRILRLIEFSVALLMAHRLRTALSVSGLLIGTATVMVMVAIGKGAERRVIDRVNTMGADVVIVSSPPATNVAGRRRQVNVTTALRTSDADAIVEESGAAIAAAPVLSRSLVARWEDRNVNVSVYATTVAGLRIRRIAALRGRDFDALEDREQRRVALVGPNAARLVFGDADPIGRQLRIGSVPFDVIGVLRSRGTDVAGTDLDMEVVVPFQTAARRVFNVPFVHAILVQAPSTDRLPELERDVREVLARRHPVRAGEGGVQPFLVQNQAVVLRTHRGAALALNRMIVAVAVLALIIGGVGVAAVLLLSLRERAREIGLRRALGARRSDIQLQFLLEAAVLAGAGSIAGVAAGLVATTVASVLGRWDVVFSWPAATLGVLTATILGLAVGVIPAARAVRLQPVAALRH